MGFLGFHIVWLLHASKYLKALVFNIITPLVLGELSATTHLYRLYGCESPDQTQCILYSLHHVQLLQRTGDRARTADALEAISHLYLNLGTNKYKRLYYNNQTKFP